MRCSASCAIFENFKSLLELILKWKSGNAPVEYYLDKFLPAGRAGTNKALFMMI